MLTSSPNSQQIESESQTPSVGQGTLNGSSKSQRAFGDGLRINNSRAPCAHPPFHACGAFACPNGQAAPRQDFAGCCVLEGLRVVRAHSLQRRCICHICLVCARFRPPPRLVPSRSSGSLAAAGQVLVDSAARMLGGHSMAPSYVRKCVCDRCYWHCLSCYVLVQLGPFKCSEAVRLQAIGPGQQPSAATVGSSCVYICQRSDGFFYCGQTDDIRGASFNAASAEMC